MKLGVAGVISGAGQGLEKGLMNLQSGMMQYGLQEEQNKRLDAREEREHSFQERKLAETQAFQERLQAGSQAHAEKLSDKTIAAHSAETDKTIAANKGQKDEDRALDREKLDHIRVKDEKDAELKETELDDKRKHYDDWYKAFTQRGAAGGKADHKGAELYVHYQEHQVDVLKEQMKNAATPAEQTAIQKEMAKIEAKIRHVTGVDLPAEASTKTDFSDVNPFPVPGEKASAGPGKPAPLMATPAQKNQMDYEPDWITQAKKSRKDSARQPANDSVAVPNMQ